MWEDGGRRVLRGRWLTLFEGESNKTAIAPAESDDIGIFSCERLFFAFLKF